MKKTALVLLTALLINLNSFSQNAENRINELLSAYAENGQFNGTILVKKGQNIIYERAFGAANREWNIPNTTDAKFLAGSCGKSITAFMTMILVNDGLIDLNATINDYIPGYSGPGKNKVTIHQMLTHTSGIPDHGAIPNLSKKLVRWTFTTDQYLDLIKDIELKFEPGTKFSYSGIAYNLLAIICEKVSKKDFGDLLTERVFIPLGMNDTKHDKNLDIDSKRAYGYEYHLLEGYMNPSYVDMTLIKGSGGILTTVEDLARFDDECFSTQKLLSKDLYKKIFTRYVKDWQYYGYGWWITDRIEGKDTLTLISHGGSTDGYKAYNTRIVNDSTDIVIFQNNYYRTELGVKFDYAITNEIIDILYGKEIPLPRKSIAKDLGFEIGHGGIDAAIKKYYLLKNDKRYFIDDVDFDQLGQELIKNYSLPDESEKIYTLALSEYPGSFIINYSYGMLLAKTNDQKSKELIRKCTEVYKDCPDKDQYAREYENAMKIISNK